MEAFDRRDIETLYRHIGEAETITVTVHTHPDGDAIGSGTAMVSYLASVGKDAVLVFPDAYPSTLEFLVTGDMEKRIIVAVVFQNFGFIHENFVVQVIRFAECFDVIGDCFHFMLRKVSPLNASRVRIA